MEGYRGLRGRARAFADCYRRGARLGSRAQGEVMDGVAIPQVELPEQPDAPKAKRRVGMIVALIIAVLAIGAFAYAVVWSGGIDQVTALIGPYLGLSSKAAAPAKTAAPGSAAGKSPADSSQMAAVALPAWAQTTMYEEQLTSQVGITSMVDDKVKSFVFAKPVAAENGVQVPLKATFRDGKTHSGTISLIKIDEAWFFAGLDTGVAKEVPSTSAVDESVVDLITKEQAAPTSQDALKAFADGSTTGMDVVSVVPGMNTASLNVVLHGGAYEGKAGRFVCVKKADGLDDFWFVTGFSWQ
jgi:hypothetical protein